MHIKDLMSHPVVTCTTADRLDAAARLMWECDCGVIPVVDDDGRLAGIVTDRDIAMAAYTQGTAIAQIPVTTAMSRDVLAIHAEESIESVERLMQHGQVRRVPVIDPAGRPIGIVSMNDLTLATARAHHSAEDRELVDTLAAVCRPRVPRAELLAKRAQPSELVAHG